jgi:glutamate-1-semialdehyde 2,1-aminomutase
VAAGLATLELLDSAAYRRLADVTRTLAEGLREAGRRTGTPIQVQSVPGLLTPFVSAAPVVNYADAKACDSEAYGAWCRALLRRGVYPPPSQFEAWFPSLAHRDEDIERTIKAAADAFAELA